MSAIASVRYLSADTFAALLDAAETNQAAVPGLLASGEEQDFGWSGYILSTLLTTLEAEYGIDLLNPQISVVLKIGQALPDTVAVLTAAEASAWAESTDPTRFDAVRLEEQFDRFSGQSASGAGEPMLAGVSFLHDVLMRMKPGHIAILSIY